MHVHFTGLQSLKKFLKYLFLFINIVAIFGLILSYLSKYIPPDKTWIFSIPGLIYPWLLLVNVSFVGFWLFINLRFSLLSLIFIMIGWNTLTGFIRIKAKTTDRPAIKLVSYNVKNFSGIEKKASRETAELIKSFLKEQEPDIICFQESLLRANRIFNIEETLKEFPSIKHYQYARTSPSGGSLTMTRFPIVNMQEIRFDDSNNIAIATDIKVDDDTIRIFNVHLQSYKIDPSQYKILESLGISSEEDMREMREIGSKYRRGIKMRAVQARMMRGKIDESPYPVIVCGDFNDTHTSYAYNKVKGNRKDAFKSSGRGIGRTYIGEQLPSFRIDYILHSKSFKSYNFTVHDVLYSDHLPISCKIVRKTKK